MGNINQKDYICDDTPIEISERLKKMSDDELKKEFQKRFGNYLIQEKFEEWNRKLNLQFA